MLRCRLTEYGESTGRPGFEADAKRMTNPEGPTSLGTLKVAAIQGLGSCSEIQKKR